MEAKLVTIEYDFEDYTATIFEDERVNNVYPEEINNPIISLYPWGGSFEDFRIVKR